MVPGAVHARHACAPSVPPVPSRDEGVTKPAPLVSSVLRAIECMLCIPSTLRRASWCSRSESKHFVTDFHFCKTTGCREKKINTKLGCESLLWSRCHE